MHDQFLRNQAAAWQQIRQNFVGGETPNGPGSTVEFTKPLRMWLVQALKDYDIRSILDAPCGDWNWMNRVSMDESLKYVGWDIEPRMIADNTRNYGGFMREFHQVNILQAEAFPLVDLIICRDFLIHLPNEIIAELLDKFKTSGARYLLATNFPAVDNEWNCPLEGGHLGLDGYYTRPVNLEADPFNFAGRVDQVHESEGREMVLFDLDLADART